MTNEEYIKFVEQTFADILQIIKNKNHDYTGGSSDPFLNVRDSVDIGVPVEKGVVIRLMDKWNRMKHILKTGSYKVKEESLADTIKDSIGYSVMLLAILNEKETKND